MAYGAIDPNHNAMSEGMRRQSRTSFVLKRHEDLRKQCEKEMTSYDKAKRLTAAQCYRSQIYCLNRMKTLLHYSSITTDKRHMLSASLPDVKVTNIRHTLRTSLSDVKVTDVRHTLSPPYEASGKKAGSVSRADVAVRSVPSSAKSYMSTSSFTGRERFLFRVLWRNGKEVYIRDKWEARQS